MALDYSRARTSLNNSNTQRSNNALYQAIDTLISTGSQVLLELKNKMNADTIIDLATQVKGLLNFKNGGVFTGVYTPNLIPVANIDSSEPFITSYTRTQNYVTVSGKIYVTPTLAAGEPTHIEVELPVKSYFINEDQLSGLLVANSLIAFVNLVGIIRANIVNGNAKLEFYADTNTLCDVRFIFTYQVVQQ